MKDMFGINYIALSGLRVFVASPLRRAAPCVNISNPFRANIASPEKAVSNSEVASPIAMEYYES